MSNAGFLGRTSAFFKNFMKRASICEEIESVESDLWGRIAVFIPHERNAWAVSAVQCFVASLREQLGHQRTPEIEIFSAQGSHERIQHILRSLKESQVRTHRYELIVTIGGWCSKEVRDGLDSLQCAIPQVFCSVYDPVMVGLVDSLESTGGEVSGVASVEIDTGRQLDLLLSLLPHVKKILLPHDPHPHEKIFGNSIRNYKDHFTALCAERNVAVQEFVVNGIHLRAQLEKALDGSIDLVCAVPDSTIVTHTDVLVEACNVARVPLCTSELSSVYNGAALGYGVQGAVYGPYTAAIVYDTLVNKRPLSTIPVVTLSLSARMCFNLAALNAQGVHLPPQVQSLLEMNSIFRDTL